MSAIDTLLKQRQELMDEQSKAHEQFQKEIDEIDAAILTLSGKKATDLVDVVRYDDEHPNYIRNTEDGI